MPDASPSMSGSAGRARGERRYRVFISYSHADTKWAGWVMRRLEGYRVPERFQGRDAPMGEVGPRIAPVFRDRDELPTTSDLGEAVRQALSESATLVVICSPAAAKSRWVNEEIVAFKRMGGGARVFAFIVGGEPKLEGAADDCFPLALRRELGADGQLSSQPAEVVAADARPHADGREVAFIRLVAGLLGVGFDDLRQRELQRRNRRMTIIAAAAVLGMALTLGLATVAWVARNDAERRQEIGEELLTFLLDDMQTRLQKAEKLDVLEATGARILEHFQSLKPRDLTDNTLTQQAKALTQIGQIRMAKLRYAEASAAFKAAYERLAALVERHPQNGEMIFERGQAEFYLGLVHRKRGETAAMGEWMVRYRDTGVALMALDPLRPTWQEELAWGHHNLAVLELDKGQFDEARRGFEAELAILAELTRLKPADLPLQFRIVDANSWLGTVAERSGDLAAAKRSFAEQVGRLESIVQAEPGTAKWRAKLADALGLHSRLLAITGERSASLTSRLRARALFAELVALDPKNQTWQLSALLFRLKEAQLLRAEGDGAAAKAVVDQSLGELERLTRAEPTDLTLASNLALAYRLQAELELAAGRPAAAAAAKARVVGERIPPDARVLLEISAELAQIEATSGECAAHDGDRAGAERHWRRSQELLRGALERVRSWWILDPVVRAGLVLGEAERIRPYQEELQRQGYQPLRPWPARGAP